MASALLIQDLVHDLADPRHLRDEPLLVAVVVAVVDGGRAALERDLSLHHDLSRLEVHTDVRAPHSQSLVGAVVDGAHAIEPRLLMRRDVMVRLAA